MFHDDHHGDGRLALWCNAPAGVQGLLVTEEPERFFVPAYVGHRGWVGVRLDVDVDWDEVAGVIRDAYVMVVPPKVAAALDDAVAPAAVRRGRRWATCLRDRRRGPDGIGSPDVP